MEALVKVNRKIARIENIPEPEPKEGEVKIKVHLAGICGTDLHILENQYHHKLPVVMGHEFAGTVAACGPGVTRFSPGDRVVSLTAAVTCGYCDFCIAGIPMLCAQRKSIGSGVNGAFAKYLTISEQLVYTIPKPVTFQAAALTEPLACVVHGLMEMTHIRAGDLAVISGPGPIGLLSAMVALAEGALVVLCGTNADQQRLELAGKLGVPHIINVEQERLEKVLRAISSDGMADVVVECAGASLSLESCLKAVRPRGRLHQMGLFGKPLLVDLDLFAFKEVRYSSSFASTPSSFKRSLALMAAGKVYPEKLVTHQFPLREWRRGFDLMKAQDGIKVLLKPE